jgi:hypothetical protein
MKCGKRFGPSFMKAVVVRMTMAAVIAIRI